MEKKLKILINTALTAIVLMSYSNVNAGEADNIQACAKKSKEYAGVILDEFSASYEGNWLSASIVKWKNVICEAKLGTVYNLTINGRSYIYEGFSGKKSYELNMKLEEKTESAIKTLESRIRLLEQRMENVTLKLKEHNPDHNTLEEYINSGIQKSIGGGESDGKKSGDETESTPQVKEKEIPVESSKAVDDYYVTSEKLNVRLAPNKTGKITNTLYMRQKVEVFQVKDGWARISRYYDGGIEGLSGDVARWVFAKYLSTNRPAEEQETNLNSPVAKAIKSTDDFSKYQKLFVSASEELIKSGNCSLGDFTEMGGWWRSTNHKPKPVYFTYCGGMTISNRIYLDTVTGKTFR